MKNKLPKNTGYFSEFSVTRNLPLMTRNIAGDTLAGIIVALVMLPLTICFGILAGGSVQSGIMLGVYATIAAGLFMGIMGGTPGAMSGPTAVIAMMVLAIFTTYKSDPKIAIGIFTLAGLIQIGIGVSKVSHSLEYVPRPIIAGLQNAAAIFMVLSGLLMVAGHLPVYPVHRIPQVFRELAVDPETPEKAKAVFNTYAIFVAAMALFVAMVATLISRYLPSGLLGLAFASILAVGAKFDITLVPRLTMPATFWPQPTLPSYAGTEIGVVMSLVSALAFAFISAILLQQNTELASNLTGKGHSSNREMLGLGIVNSMGWFIGAMPVTGSADETRIGVAAGGRTPFVSIVSAVATFMVVIFLALGLKYVPMAAFGGLIIFLGFRSMDWETTLSVSKMPVVESAAMVLIMLAMLFAHFVIAAFLAAILTLILLTRRFSKLLDDQIMTLKPTERRWAGEDLIPDELRKVIVFARPDSPLTLYETLVQVSEQTLHNKNFKALVIRLNRIPTLDESAAAALTRMIHITKERQGLVFFTGIKSKLMQGLIEWGLAEQVGDQNIFARFTVCAKFLTEQLGKSAAVQRLGLTAGTREWEGQALGIALKNYVLKRKLMDSISLLAATLVAGVLCTGVGFGFYYLLKTFGYVESPWKFGSVFGGVLLAIVVIMIILERQNRSPIISSHDRGDAPGGLIDQFLVNPTKLTGGCLFAVPGYLAITAEEVINLMSKRFRDDVIKKAGRALAMIQVDLPYSFLRENMGLAIEYDLREALFALRDLDLASWAPTKEDSTVVLTELGRKFVEEELAQVRGVTPGENDQSNSG